MTDIQKAAKGHYGPDKRRTYRYSQLNELFHVAHQAGAKRHPREWLLINQCAAKAISDCGQRTDDTTIKAVVSVVLLRVLDLLRPVGMLEEPTDENIKTVLAKISEMSGG